MSPLHHTLAMGLLLVLDGQLNVTDFPPQAPVIALFADITTAVPVYVSGAIIIACGGIALLLPYEPRGKASI